MFSSSQGQFPSPHHSQALRDVERSQAMIESRLGRVGRVEELRVEEQEPLQVFGNRVTCDQCQAAAESSRHYVLQPIVARGTDGNFRPRDPCELSIGVHQALQRYGGTVHADVVRQQSRKGIRNRLQVV
jgi:hypothetical protein